MKFYFKIFIVSFISFSLMIGSGMFAYLQSIDPVFALEGVDGITDANNLVDNDNDNDGSGQEEVVSELQTLLMESSRVNFLVFGHDGARADTIIFVSYDLDNNFLDLVNIPRDTYNKVAGYDGQGQDKINAVYGYGDENGGSLGLKAQISKMLGVPIQNYVKVSYKGVESIIDSLGGIEVSVPFDMIYDDEWAKPPLHIDIKAGTQVLNGKKSVEYLRWRKNNDGSHDQGDIQRITRQQDYIKKAIRKSLSFKLPTVARTVFNYVKTDLEIDELLRFVSSATSGFDMSKMKTYSLPGSVETMNRLSYYIHEPGATEELMIQIYKRTE